ncbi:NADP-dependent oxidoreductase [Leifsonia poae]|uniref:NADP-dependent oxidoreductase n=1 Tax=Leifsonia poae TaxID=110933 RepID=UPI003D69F37F
MTETMRAITQDELGGPEVLHPATIDRPEPGIGQVLLRVEAAGVNPADAMNRQTGLFSGKPPFVLGWDVSGVVEKVGPGVTLFAPGDEVFGLLPFPRGGGAYAEFAIAPARALVRKPSGLSHVQAAALPLAGLTAWQALVETAGVDHGSRVLITGAAGGVGHLAVQIAAARGAEVIGLTSEANAGYVRSSARPRSWTTGPSTSARLSTIWTSCWTWWAATIR